MSLSGISNMRNNINFDKFIETPGSTVSSKLVCQYFNQKAVGGHLNPQGNIQACLFTHVALRARTTPYVQSNGSSGRRSRADAFSSVGEATVCNVLIMKSIPLLLFI